MTYSLAELNQMDQLAFTVSLGVVFEQTPAIAAATWLQRPFADLTDLHQKMVEIIQSWSPEQQLQLIRAHPDLGSKAKMADASVQEQARVGLDQLTPAEYQQFRTLNQAYQDQFGFPFIIAVRNHTKTSILEAFTQRLNHTPDAEMSQAIAEIAQIALFRLTDLITPD